MTECSPIAAAAIDLAIRKSAGQVVPDDLVQEVLPVAGQAVYAKQLGLSRDLMATDWVNGDKHLPDSVAGKALRKMGAVDSWLNLTMDSQSYLGRNYTQPLLDALQDHYEQTQGKDFQAYKDRVVPVVEQLKSEIQSRFKDSARIGYANEWLDYWEHGGKFYAERPDQSSKISQAIMTPVNTAIGNLVGNNPFIAVAHTFQITPKALAIYGPQATLRGMADWAASVAANKTINIPELINKGAIHEHGKFDIVGPADNIGRGLSYYIAEAAHPGRGMEGVHNISFGYQLGREPMVMWYKPGAAQVALMRYALSGTKMYGGWLKNIYDGARTGDLSLAGKGAAALASYSAAQAIFTGVRSTIPAPVWALLPQETKDTIAELDKAFPALDLVQKATGRDIGEHYQPLGGIALGVGASLVNSDMKAGFKGYKNAAEDLQKGDLTRAAVDFTKGTLTYGQPLIPGLRLTYKKLFDIVGDMATGDLPAEDAPEEAAVKFHFPAAATQ